MSKTASPTVVSAAGQAVSYSFRVANTGNVSLAGVGVTETAFSGSGVVSAISCPVTTLAPGAFTTCTATYVATQADIDAGAVISNTASARGTPPGGAVATAAPSTASVAVTRAPSLTVAKSASTPVVEAGQSLTYSFAVTNTGNTTIAQPAIVEQAFTGSGALSPVTCPPGVILPPGGRVTCTVTYLVQQSDIDRGSISNTATATAVSPGGPAGPSGPSTVVVSADTSASLTLAIAADTPSASAAGQLVTYSFRITNTGRVSVTNPTVADLDHAGSAALAGLACSGPPVLPPAFSTDCTATYLVQSGDFVASALITSARASGSVAGGGSVVSSMTSATIALSRPVVPVLPGSVAATGVTPAPTSRQGAFGALAVTGSRVVASGVIVGMLLAMAGASLNIVGRRRGRHQR